ncbi:MAG: flagellar basal body rod protein FlgB [Desulfatitalea sp.]|nr:flagellar basal body rod protein FlgB [Desulfatitalea sp.]NNJ99869.1 flagellar basal body rod protein FlgB [Desulfatitalea sp.]
MNSKTLFDGTINLAEKSLDLRSRRHALILSNIANADTPDYKAFDLLVEKALARQVPSTDHLALKLTDPGHVPAGGAADTAIKPEKIELSTQVTLRGDGNTVDLDREMAGLATNHLQYKLASQVLIRKFQGLKNVISGGK